MPLSVSTIQHPNEPLAKVFHFFKYRLIST
nr:MAG TPA: hypothetical protein [Caudoviricetes sp.]